MTGSKRQREFARAKYERQQARRATSAARRRKQQRIIAVAVVAALVIGAGIWVALGRSSSDTPVAEVTPAVSLSPSTAASFAASPSAPAPSAASAQPSASEAASDAASAEPALLDCTAPGTPRADDKTYSSAPAADGTAATSLTLATNCGDIVIALDAAAPATVASAAFLAKDGFYDSTQCHRLTTAGIYVLQCGDPKGDGSGGPGYVLPDENLPDAAASNYPAGTVAMANAGSGTAGSQFFIVYEDSTLDPATYTIWGKVTAGLDIVQEVASAGVAGGGTDGAPTQPVFIESATVQAS